MKKRILYTVFACLLAVPSLFAATIVSGTARVDGVVNSTEAVITSHQPVFSWEFSGSVSSFTVTVSTDSAFTSSVWSYIGSTDSINTINYITRVQYDERHTATAQLIANSVYYWQVTIYDNGVSASDGGQFRTTASAVNPAGEKYDLVIDWNNPFYPSRNQATKFRFGAKDSDRKLKLRIFTLSGELVAEWPEQTALKDAIYTVTWNGKNSNNETVARGIYLVNITDVGDKDGITRKVAVINDK
jgi:hypothetical protein